MIVHHIILISILYLESPFVTHSSPQFIHHYFYFVAIKLIYCIQYFIYTIEHPTKQSIIFHFHSSTIITTAMVLVDTT